VSYLVALHTAQQELPHNPASEIWVAYEPALKIYHCVYGQAHNFAVASRYGLDHRMYATASQRLKHIYGKLWVIIPHR
jgi:hypothetical protein